MGIELYYSESPFVAIMMGFLFVINYSVLAQDLQFNLQSVTCMKHKVNH